MTKTAFYRCTLIFVKGVQTMYEIFEQLLQKYGYSVYKVSKDTGIPQTTLYSWKKNNSKLAGDTAKILANYFGVSIDYLMGEDEEKENEFEIKDSVEMKAILLCRKVEGVSPEEKEMLLKQFESTIDLFLKAKGIK